MVGVVQTDAVGSIAAPARSSSALGRYVEALDGMRALPMAAVFCYHAGLQGFDGAFLGLSLFFTLSGYLITSMLLRAHRAKGAIDLGTFWTRRYRRLLPAAYLTLAGVVVFGATVASEQQVEALPGSIAACLAQVANWYFIVADQSYVALFSAPSPVHHFWSLALEEQFYLLFPIAMVLLLRRTTSMKVIAGVLAGSALLSTAITVVLFERGASLDRVYLGTDTRAAEILVGAVLAVILHRRPVPTAGPVARALPWVGLVCGLITLWSWHAFKLTDPVFYQGGLLAFSFVSAGLILSAVSGRGPAAAVLSWGPLPAFGRITYGFYLVHWPILLWLDEERTGLTDPALFVLRATVTLAIATASYNLIEMPIRDGRWPRTRVHARWIAAPAAVAILMSAVVVSQRDVETDLAGLGTGPITAPAAADDDGVLDVLLITDTGAAALADDLEGASHEPVQVSIAAPFRCSGVDGEGSGATCANWLEEWPALVEQHDPDVVLLQLDDWAAADIAETSGVDGTTAATEWTNSVLAAGFDLLTTRGAVIVWSQDGSISMADAVQRRNEPFYLSMADLSGRRSDLRRRAVQGREPEALVADLAFNRRSGGSGAPRIMVVGDSTAGTMAYGLAQWGSDTGRAVVWSAATEGCGIADDGEVRDVSGRPTAVPGVCREVIDRWTAAVDEFEPDVVLVMSQLLDLQARRLEDWNDFLVPGDEAFDRYLLDEYRTAYEVLASNGASVVWFDVPCSENALGMGSVEDGVFDRDRVRHINESVLPSLAEDEPDLERFDLFGVLCPDGRYVEDLDGIEDVRPDGIHFGAAGAAWFAETYGDDLLAMGS